MLQPSSGDQTLDCCCFFSIRRYWEVVHTYYVTLFAPSSDSTRHFPSPIAESSIYLNIIHQPHCIIVRICIKIPMFNFKHRRKKPFDMSCDVSLCTFCFQPQHSRHRSSATSCWLGSRWRQFHPCYGAQPQRKCMMGSPGVSAQLGA